MMTAFDFVIWFGVIGQFLRLVSFGVLFILAIMEILRGKNGIIIGLLLVAAGSSLNGLVSVFVPTPQLIHILTRFYIGLGAWLMGLGAAWIIYRIRGK